MYLPWETERRGRARAACSERRGGAYVAGASGLVTEIGDEEPLHAPSGAEDATVLKLSE
jgi:hypothetical protein